MQKRTLYWHETGPLIAYGSDTILIGSLNPQQEIKWRMSRWEMFKLGWQCLFSAVR